MASGGAGGLLKFDDRDFTVSAAGGGYKRTYLKATNGNRFEYYCGRRGTSYLVLATPDDTSKTWNAAWPAVFSLNAGDVLDFVLKDVTVTCDKSSSYNGYVQVTLRRESTGAAVVGWTGNTSESPLYAVGGSPKQYTELSVSYTAQEDIDLAAIQFYSYGSAQSCNMKIQCDVEVYVNGTRVM